MINLASCGCLFFFKFSNGGHRTLLGKSNSHVWPHILHQSIWLLSVWSIRHLLEEAIFWFLHACLTENRDWTSALQQQMALQPEEHVFNSLNLGFITCNMGLILLNFFLKIKVVYVYCSPWQLFVFVSMRQKEALNLHI